MTLGQAVVSPSTHSVCAAVVLGVLVPPDEEVLTQLPRDLRGLTVIGNLLRGQDLRSAELTVRLIVHGDDLTAVDQPEILRDMREFRGQRALRQIDHAYEFSAPAPPASSTSSIVAALPRLRCPTWGHIGAIGYGIAPICPHVGGVAAGCIIAQLGAPPQGCMHTLRAVPGVVVALGRTPCRQQVRRADQLSADRHIPACPVALPYRPVGH